MDAEVVPLGEAGSGTKKSTAIKRAEAMERKVTISQKTSLSI